MTTPLNWWTSLSATGDVSLSIAWPWHNQHLQRTGSVSRFFGLKTPITSEVKRALCTKTYLSFFSFLVAFLFDWEVVLKHHKLLQDSMSSQLCSCLHFLLSLFKSFTFVCQLGFIQIHCQYFRKKRAEQNFRAKSESALEIKLAIIFYCFRPSPMNNFCNIAWSQRNLNTKTVNSQFDKTQTSCVMQLKVRQGDKSFNLPLGDIGQIFGLT